MKCMTVTVLCCLAIGRYAGAMDKPPEAPENQRSWLRGGLLNDMTETEKRMPGTFATREYARAKALANPSASPSLKISDEDVDLLADYYYRTRARAEEDLQQFQRQLPRAGQFPGQLPNPQQAGPTDEELKAAKADREGISALGGKLADKGDAVKSLSELIYASLPGFCLHQQQTLPASYFDFDQRNAKLNFTGPVYDRTFAGCYAAPIDICVNAAAARQAYWLRRVLWWHNRPNPITRPPAGGTGNGNLGGRTGVYTPQRGAEMGTGNGSLRAPRGPSANQGAVGGGTRITGRNAANQ